MFLYLSHALASKDIIECFLCSFLDSKTFATKKKIISKILKIEIPVQMANIPPNNAQNVHFVFTL
jgi:hypothetical protein